LAIQALNFIYDNISSEVFSVKIVNFNSSGLQENNFGGNVIPIYESIKRKHNVFLYGTQPSQPLEFELNIATEGEELDSYSLGALGKWLFGHQDWKWLQIEQVSYEGLWFKCLLLDPQVISVGNMNIGFKCKVFCDSSYVYSDEFTYNHNITTSNQQITFNNLSDANLYLYPYISFTTSSTTTSFSIKNSSDSDREFKFTSIANNETITVNNDLKIITSSTSNNRLSNFNLKWLRLVPGTNNLVVNGNGSMFLRMRFPVKVGG